MDRVGFIYLLHTHKILIVTGVLGISLIFLIVEIVVGSHAENMEEDMHIALMNLTIAVDTHVYHMSKFLSVIQRQLSVI